MFKTYKISTFFLFFTFLPLYVSAATLSVSPQSGTFEVGDKVTVRINVSSSEPVNAISGEIAFPTSILNVESVSKSGSILNFWVSEPNFSQGAGTLRFEGVTLSGFPGGTGTVVTTVLRAVKPGSGTVSFKSGQILANDGQGTDVTGNLSGATYSVEAKKETVKASPEQKAPSQQIEQAAEVKAPETTVSISPENITQASKEITISVGNKFSDIYSGIKLVIGILLFVIVCLIVLVIFYVKKNRKLKREIRKAENTIRKSFRLLRNETDKEIKSDLNEAEDVISKEIEDIEKT